MKDEKTLIEALKRREADAFAQVFTLYSDKMYRLAIQLLHDEQQADGVVQNSFLALIEHIDSFEGRSSIGTWLYRVAYNDAMQRIRKAKPQSDLSLIDEQYEEMPTCFVDWQNIPERMMSNHEAYQQIEQAITTLSPSLRAVFLLRDIEELSTQETAESLGISVSAVKVRLHRARLALREQLASYFEERIME